MFNVPAYKTYGALIAQGKFEPAGFAAPLGYKDIRLTLAAAESLRVPMPLGSLLHDRFLRSSPKGATRSTGRRSAALLPRMPAAFSLASVVSEALYPISHRVDADPAVPARGD